MHAVVTGLRRRLGRRRRSQRGVIAMMVALSMTALLIASAMVLDFGLVRIDRQVNKSGADAATRAGLYGLFGGDGKPHPYQGICSAISYLAKNDTRFSGVTGGSGVWTDGAGTAQAADCSSTTWLNRACTGGTLSTWAKYAWNGTYQGQALKVEIQSGYSLVGTDFPEDALAGVQADSTDDLQGCDQFAVIITQNRKPGLGSLASSADLVSRIRTVGRIYSPNVGDAPAMLLLKRTGCPVLETGSNGGGSYVHVYGAVSSNGRSQPGSIHSDSTAAGCVGSLFNGKAGAGIVAYAAPLVSNPLLPDPTKPGQITSLAGSNGVGIGTIRDSASNVYSSAALNEAGAAAAAKTEPTGRKLVTRSLVDDRYLGLGSPTTGVTKAVADAQSTVFGAITNTGLATAAGYKVVNSCSATASDLTGIVSADKVYVNCTANAGYTGTVAIQAHIVVFAGSVKPPNGSPVSLPNADHVYIFGDPTKDAISLGAGGTLSVHTAGNLNGSTCSTAQTASKAVMFIKAGQIKETGGLLQLCNTTVFMMGNQSGGCLPTTSGTAPTLTGCGGGLGDGQLSQTGGNVDWTAPNQYDLMTLSNGDPDPAKAPAWVDPNGPEDLAFWDESGGNSSSGTYNMNGSGVLHTVGVYMVPNADPFSIGGGAHQDLTNAQYVATSIALNGNTTSITMRVDANSAVQLPKQSLVGLVR